MVCTPLSWDTAGSSTSYTLFFRAYHVAAAADLSTSSYLRLLITNFEGNGSRAAAPYVILRAVYIS